MVRIDRIYTRGGDQGQTSLGDGSRVSKLNLRIAASGAVDEVNCALGVAAAADSDCVLVEPIRGLQQFLFDLGADLCVPLPEDGESDALPARVTPNHITHLESFIDGYAVRLRPLTSFILPGGTALAAALHLARAVCRRAELAVLHLAQEEPLNPSLLIALNRLSDLIFVMARIANDEGRVDVLWQAGRFGSDAASG